MTISDGNFELCVLTIAEETGLDANLVAEKVKELICEAEKKGDLKDGQLVVGYLAQVPDIADNLESMALKLQDVMDKMCYVEHLLLPAKNFLTDEEKAALVNRPFPVNFIVIKTNDIWIRDYGPFFMKSRIYTDST